MILPGRAARVAQRRRRGAYFNRVAFSVAPDDVNRPDQAPQYDCDVINSVVRIASPVGLCRLASTILISRRVEQSTPPRQGIQKLPIHSARVWSTLSPPSLSYSETDLWQKRARISASPQPKLQGVEPYGEGDQYSHREERERLDKLRVMAGGNSTITERFVPNCNDLETYLMVNAHLETRIDKAIKRLVTLKEFKRIKRKPGCAIPTARGRLVE